jgi:hypothetical protein
VATKFIYYRVTSTLRPVTKFYETREILRDSRNIALTVTIALVTSIYISVLFSKRGKSKKKIEARGQADPRSAAVYTMKPIRTHKSTCSNHSVVQYSSVQLLVCVCTRTHTAEFSTVATSVSQSGTNVAAGSGKCGYSCTVLNLVLYPDTAVDSTCFNNVTSRYPWSMQITNKIKLCAC